MVTLLLLLPKYTQSPSICQYLPQYTSLKPDSSANPDFPPFYISATWKLESSKHKLDLTMPQFNNFLWLLDKNFNIYRNSEVPY